MPLESRSNSDRVSAALVPTEAEHGSWERGMRACRCGLRLLGGTPSPMTLSPGRGQIQEPWMRPGCRAQSSLSPEPMDFCFPQRSDSFPGPGQVDQPQFHAQDLLSCRSPASWGVGASKALQRNRRRAARGRTGRGPEPSSLCLLRPAARSLRFSPVACFAHDRPGRSCLREIRGCPEPPPGARPLPSTLPSRGVGTRRAQGNGPRVRPPLLVNYAGGWHRCSSYSSFPGNFHSGIPPSALRAASPARLGPQAPSLGCQAAQPRVPGNQEGSGRRRRRLRPRPRPLGGGPLRKPAGATLVTSSCKLRLGLRGCLQDL